MSKPRIKSKGFQCLALCRVSGIAYIAPVGEFRLLFLLA